MVRKIMMLVAASVCCAFCAQATEYTWTTTSDGGDCLKITGVSPSLSGAVTIPSQIGGINVTAIDNRAFEGSGGIVDVILPSTLTNMGYDVFAGCSNLKTVRIPPSLRTIHYSAFGNTAIESLTVPEGVVSVRGEAFRDMQNLKSVSLPSTLSSIGWNETGSIETDQYYNPFTGCDPQCVFCFPNGNAWFRIEEGHLISNDGILLSGYVDSDTVHIPEGVRLIGGDSFNGRATLKKVVFPSTARVIAINAFYECDGLETVELNEGLIEIGSQAFISWNGCKLSSIKFPESLRSIEWAPFRRSAIQALDIPAAVTNFRGSAYGMTELQSITFRGDAPNLSGYGSNFWGENYSGGACVPADAIVYVKRGSRGWDCNSGGTADAYSEELPDYWPVNDATYGRKIEWYGDDPEDWTNPWWNKLNVSFSDDGWTGCRGVYTSPEWKDATYSSSVHTNTAKIAVNEAGIIAFEVKAIGADTQGRYLHVVVDGQEMTSLYPGSTVQYSSRSPKWTHLEYAIGQEGSHVITVEYRVPNNYYGKEGAYFSLQNVVWTPKSEWVKPDYVWSTIDNGDGTVSITSVSPAPAFDVEIPSEVGGKRVTSMVNASTSYPYYKSIFPTPSLITTIQMPSSITRIGPYCFYECSRLGRVVLSPCLASVGKYAFGMCVSLPDVTLPSTLTAIGEDAFYHCESLSDIVIPQGVTSIGSSIFHYCSTLMNVRMPASVTEIPSRAFAYCYSLAEIIFEGDCPGGYVAYSDTYTGVPKTCAIKVCKDTTGWGDVPGTWNGFPIDYLQCRVVFDLGAHGSRAGGGETDQTVAGGTAAVAPTVAPNEGWEFMGWDSAFACVKDDITVKALYARADGCNYTETVGDCTWTFSVANGVAEIGVRDEVGRRKGMCAISPSSAESVSVPETLGSRLVTGIADGAFEGCAELKSVTIPAGITNISASAFSDSGIREFTVAEENVVYKSEDGLLLNKDGSILVAGVNGEVSIPTGVAAVGTSAFLNRDDLTSVAIPASVTEIGSEAFSGCEKLADVWFEGDTIGKIGQHAFLGCSWDLIMHVPADWQGRGRTIAGYTVWRGGSSDVEKCVNMTVTNVVVQYVLNSIRSEIAVPVSNSVGIVNIITEVASSGAVSVPTEWKDNYPQFGTKFGTDFGKALAMKTGKKDSAGNDMFVWQDFVAGTDPTDENDQFSASITIVDGVPVISYTPELTADQAALRVYKTYGKMKLTDTAWMDITAKTSEERANYNFFKVSVEMK